MAAYISKRPVRYRNLMVVIIGCGWGLAGWITGIGVSNDSLWIGALGLIFTSFMLAQFLTFALWGDDMTPAITLGSLILVVGAGLVASRIFSEGSLFWRIAFGIVGVILCASGIALMRYGIGVLNDTFAQYPNRKPGPTLPNLAALDSGISEKLSAGNIVAGSVHAAFTGFSRFTFQYLILALSFWPWTRWILLHFASDFNPHLVSATVFVICIVVWDVKDIPFPRYSLYRRGTQLIGSGTKKWIELDRPSTLIDSYTEDLTLGLQDINGFLRTEAYNYLTFNKQFYGEALRVGAWALGLLGNYANAMEYAIKSVAYCTSPVDEVNTLTVLKNIVPQITDRSTIEDLFKEETQIIENESHLELLLRIKSEIDNPDSPKNQEASDPTSE